METSFVRRACDVIDVSAICPYFFQYERLKQDVTTVLLFVVNVSSLLYYAYWMNPIKETALLSPSSSHDRLDDISGEVLPCIAKMGFLTLLHILLNRLNTAVLAGLQTLCDEVATRTKELELFFASMSHELRNPFNSLLGSVELLELNRERPMMFKEIVDTIKYGVDFLLLLVSTILDFSKLRDKKMELALIPCQVKDLLNHIIKFHYPLAQAKGLKLSVAFAANLPSHLSLDEHRLGQIVTNLVSNAIKFTKAGKVMVYASWNAIPQHEISNQAPHVAEAVRSSDWTQFCELSEDTDVLLKPQCGTIESRASCLTVTRNRFTKTNIEEQTDEAVTARLSGQNFLQPLSPHDLEDEKQPPRRGVLKLQVMDTGMGIPKSSIPKLFQPFKQAANNVAGYL